MVKPQAEVNVTPATILWAEFLEKHWLYRTTSLQTRSESTHSTGYSFSYRKVHPQMQWVEDYRLAVQQSYRISGFAYSLTLENPTAYCAVPLLSISFS